MLSEDSGCDRGALSCYRALGVVAYAANDLEARSRTTAYPALRFLVHVML